MYCVRKARRLVHKSPTLCSDGRPRRNKHIKAYGADFGNQSKSDSETEAHDAIDDLMVHMVDITDSTSKQDQDTIQYSDYDQEAVNVFCHLLIDCAIMHTLKHLVPGKEALTATITGQGFRGISIDIGAGMGNTSSPEQYMAYNYHVECPHCINCSKAAMCHFGNCSEQSQGTVSIFFPLVATTATFNACTLVHATVLLLIFIDNMDYGGLYFNDITDLLIHSQGDQYIRLQEMELTCLSHAIQYYRGTIHLLNEVKYIAALIILTPTS